MENAFEYVSSQLKEIEEFVKNSEDSYDDLYEHVEVKLDELRVYANQHDVPLIVDAEELISQHREESSEYEESSSSYYEEESEYEEEDDDDEVDQQKIEDENDL